MEKAQLYSLFKNPQLLNSETLLQLKQVTEQYPLFQAGWILYLKNLKILNDKSFDEELKKVAIRVQDRKALYKYINDVTEIEPFLQMNTERQPVVVGQEYKIEGDDSAPGNPLIDRFLSTGFSSFGADDNDVDTDYLQQETVEIDEELSEENSRIDEDLVTETLAMLYYKQKKYDQAIEAFKKLSLKFPEKSVYFATRIEEIEKLKTL